VIDVEDDKYQVLSTSIVQTSGSHDQNQASTSSAQVQDQQASTSSHDQPSTSNQVCWVFLTSLPKVDLVF